MSKEIIDKLNENVFKQAIIGLVNKGSDSDLETLRKPYQKIYISKGFALKQYEDCSLNLRNDKGLVVDSLLEDHPNYQSINNFFNTAQIQQKPLSVELMISLDGLSDKKGRRPYRLKNKAEKAVIYEIWRVQLKAKIGSLPIVLSASRNGEEKSIKGEILTFTFDDEILSRQFDTSFRLAIKLCQSYKPPKADKPNPLIWKN